MSESDDEFEQAVLVVEPDSTVKFLRWLVLVLIVISSGNFIRSFYVQDATDRATKAADSIEATSAEGRDASVDVRTKLNEILAQLEAPDSEPNLSNQAVIDALETIERIEFYLCGGLCPEP